MFIVEVYFLFYQLASLVFILVQYAILFCKLPLDAYYYYNLVYINSFSKTNIHYLCLAKDMVSRAFFN